MPPTIDKAKTFWIEAGAMSGPPEHRHQIEFSNDLVQFFDKQSRDNEVLTIQLPDGTEVPRPLTYRGTDYGQWTNIWRLGLPTQNMGGPQYAGRYIRFDRIKTGTYRIDIQNAGKEVEGWRKQSKFVGNTGGPNGREYGFF